MRFLEKVFEKNSLPSVSLRVLGGRSVIYLETKQNGVQLNGPGGRSAACPRTVRGGEAESPPGLTGTSDSR
jgi:hypothetical protein